VHRTEVLKLPGGRGAHVALNRNDVHTRVCEQAPEFPYAKAFLDGPAKVVTHLRQPAIGVISVRLVKKYPTARLQNTDCLSKRPRRIGHVVQALVEHDERH